MAGPELPEAGRSCPHAPPCMAGERGRASAGRRPSALTAAAACYTRQVRADAHTPTVAVEGKERLMSFTVIFAAFFVMLGCAALSFVATLALQKKRQ